jgi:hypothetical protein
MSWWMRLNCFLLGFNFVLLMGTGEFLFFLGVIGPAIYILSYVAQEDQNAS